MSNMILTLSDYCAGVSLTLQQRSVISVMRCTYGCSDHVLGCSILIIVFFLDTIQLTVHT